MWRQFLGPGWVHKGASKVDRDPDAQTHTSVLATAYDDGDRRPERLPEGAQRQRWPGLPADE
jgi:hypothetical protein